MRLTATSKFGAGRPPVLSMSDLQSVCEMLRCINADVGPILKLVSFLGAGQVGGGAYAGHTEMVDLDGIFRAIYKEASLQTGLNETLFGGGKGFDLITTTMSSLGEAIERLIAALVSSSPHLPADRKVGSYDEMVGSGYPVISPAAIGLFSEDQYKQPNFLYRPFMTNLPIQWIEARRVCSGDKVWIPAQLVDMVHVYDPAESIVGYPVSGGLSCHRSYAEALYHGITEVVERDAINVSWYTDARPYVVDLEGLSDRHLLGFFESVEVNCSRWLVPNWCWCVGGLGVGGPGLGVGLIHPGFGWFGRCGARCGACCGRVWGWLGVRRAPSGWVCGAVRARRGGRCCGLRLTS